MNMGTVIKGTHRSQDLIPAFLNTLRECNSTGYEQMVANNAMIPAYVDDEGDESEWWNSEDAYWMIDGLFDALNQCAPEGYYFGAHIGDGSDFGFWEDEV